MKKPLIYDFVAKTFECDIRLDSTITICQYMTRHIPEKVKYYCDSALPRVDNNIAINTSISGNE